jgi:small subunit ribosomal protein S4
VLPQDEVRVAPASKELTAIRAALESASRGGPIAWITVDLAQATGKLTELPARDAIPVTAEEQLIVELYSK